MPIHLTLIYVISAVLSFIMGIAVFFQMNNQKSNQAFLLFTLVQVFWIASLYLGYYFVFKSNPNSEISVVFIKLAYGFGILMFPMLSVFFYFFPKVTFKVNRWLNYLFWLATVGIFLVASFSDLVHKDQIFVDGAYVADEFGHFYKYYIGLLVIFLITAASIAIQKSIALKGIEKKKVLVSAIGCWAFLFMAGMTNVILPLFGIYKIGFFNLVQNSPLYTLAFIMPTFYAMQKYRFFNISNFSLNFVRKIMLYVIAVGITYLFHLVLVNIFDETQTQLLWLVSILFGIFALRYSEAKLPELITTGFRQFRSALHWFNSEIYACDNYKKLRSLMEEVFLVKLNLEKAGVYIVRKQKKDLEIPVYKENTFTNEIKKFKKDILVRSEINYLKISPKRKKVFKKELKKMNAEICAPLFSEENFIGIFVLGAKSSGEPYAKEEIEEIKRVKENIQVVLMNILLNMNLQEENDLMKAAIEEKTKELKKRIDEINALLKQQADFIAVTAHEFRTPLSVALFQMDELMDEKNKPKSLKKQLNVVNDSLENLKSLTHKLFEVQKYDLKKAKPKKEKTDISKFVKQIYKDLAAIKDEKSLKFDLENKIKKPTYVKIDKDQMRQVLNNLVSNAQKFTDKNGKIKITLQTKKDHVLIGVLDDGKGVPDKFKKTIFEKFRTKSTSAGSGLGLGLYICKKIVELHNGRIWVEDSEKGGAAFYIQLKKIKAS